MSTTRRLVMISLCLSSFLCVSPFLAAGDSTQGKINIAIMELQNNTRDAELPLRLAELLRIIVTEFKGYTVIDSSVYAEVARKKEIDYSKACDAAGAVALLAGQGVDVILIGSLGYLGRQFSLDIKLINPVNGDIIRGSGIEFSGLNDIRNLLRGVLQKILDMQNVAGRPVKTEYQIKNLEKKSHIALNLSIFNAVSEGTFLGLALSIPQERNQFNIWTGLAMIPPPLASIYAEDWSYTPVTIGFSAGSGVFTFVGSALRVNNQGDRSRKNFGNFLVYVGGIMKATSVLVDIIRAPIGVREYNKRLRNNYFIADTGVKKRSRVNICVIPVLQKEYAGCNVYIQPVRIAQNRTHLEQR